MATDWLGKKRRKEGDGDEETTGSASIIAEKLIERLESENSSLKDYNYKLERRIESLREENKTLRELRKKDQRTIIALKAKVDALKSVKGGGDV